MVQHNPHAAVRFNNVPAPLTACTIVDGMMARAAHRLASMMRLGVPQQACCRQVRQDTGRVGPSCVQGWARGLPITVHRIKHASRLDKIGGPTQGLQLVVCHALGDFRRSAFWIRLCSSCSQSGCSIFCVNSDTSPAAELLPLESDTNPCLYIFPASDMVATADALVLLLSDPAQNQHRGYLLAPDHLPDTLAE